MRKLVYYVAMTIDGFIAAPDGSFDFFPITEDVRGFITGQYPDTLPTAGREQLGVDGPNPNFDLGIQGRLSYELAVNVGVTSPYAHLRQYVVSSSLGQSPDPEVEIISGDPLAKVRELKAENGKDIYLIGGGQLAGDLLPEIDELVIKLYPVVAGDGIPLFRAGFSPVLFELTGTEALESGMVVLKYKKK